MQAVPLLKVVVAGNGAVGKTSLIRRFCEGKFQASRVATIGVDFYTHGVKLKSGPVKLSIWDMAGQARFAVVREGFYRGSRAAALVYDVTDPVSLTDLKRWREEVLRSAPLQGLAVVGNKVDLGRAVSAEDGKAYADSIGALYLETSALSGQGVAALFEALAELASTSGRREKRWWET
ncbi:MAG: GTP-binding protein [Anaerolineales bacterium]|nr:MAG: GTP-binding protein [Anaerolineales bacterium]